MGPSPRAQKGSHAEKFCRSGLPPTTNGLLPTIKRESHFMRSLERLLLFLFFLGSLFSSCEREGTPTFDEEKAFSQLLKQCSFGPRNPGSQGHHLTKTYLLQEIKAYADLVQEQSFSFFDGERKSELQFTNLIASFQPQKGERILLAAHWDTRPQAERDKKPEARSQPILGANDGASGVAVLLEIARLLHQFKTRKGVDIVFFDGEDYGKEGEIGLLGSEHFAKQLPNYSPEFGILLDMIGDKDLEIYKEGYSQLIAPEVVEKIWRIAKSLKSQEFHPQVRYYIVDDHLPLLKRGIKCINLIDFDYPYWHALEDTPDKCSSRSLKIIGDILVKLLYG